MTNHASFESGIGIVARHAGAHAGRSLQVSASTAVVASAVGIGEQIAGASIHTFVVDLVF